MKYFTVRHILGIHARVIEESGGDPGILGLDRVDSAVAQPRMGFGGEDLYPTVAEKASALAYSLNMNHPFQDGNKRTAFMAMWMFLARNRYCLDATVDDAESAIVGVASSAWDRETFTAWVRRHVVRRG